LVQVPLCHYFAMASDKAYLRWYYLGQQPKRGKVAKLAPGSHHVAESLLACLADHGEELGRFDVWVHSDSHSGYMLLKEVEGLVAARFEDDAGHYEIQLRLEEHRRICSEEQVKIPKSYFGIGIMRGKRGHNHGTLWRSATQLGASFTFTIGQRYDKEEGDTLDSTRLIPYFPCDDWAEFVRVRPQRALLVGVEMGGTPLPEFKHPECCVYLLGAEDHGLPAVVRQACQHVVSIPSVRTESYNVAVAGSLLMYDRLMKDSRSSQLVGTHGIGRECSVSGQLQTSGCHGCISECGRGLLILLSAPRNCLFGVWRSAAASS